MSQSTIASTTDSQEQVDRAANYDVEVGHDESPVTEGPHVTITLSNSPADVDQASYDYRDDAPHALDGRFTQQAAEKPLPVQSTTDSEEVVREESAKLRQHQETTGRDYADYPRARQGQKSQLLG